MRAAWYEKNGPAAEVLKVGDLPDPVPGPGEVLVRLHASAVNPSDVKARAGARKVMGNRVIPNSDGAGIIERVAPGVDPSFVGRRVWVYNAQWDRPCGTSAQYVSLPSTLTVPLAAQLSFEQGACLGIPLMTAHRCLFADGPVAGKTVLVTGGAGVVGHYAIQLAKWGGARVVSTVSSPEKAEHARMAGAEVLINYRKEDVIERIRATVGSVDRVVDVDFGANLELTPRILRPHGVISSYASLGNLRPVFPYFELSRLNAIVRPVYVYTMPDSAKAQAHADITRWLNEAQPMFAIAARFPLSQIVRAHLAVEGGKKIGHVILTLD